MNQLIDYYNLYMYEVSRCVTLLFYDIWHNANQYVYTLIRWYMKVLKNFRSLVYLTTLKAFVSECFRPPCAHHQFIFCLLDCISIHLVYKWNQYFHKISATFLKQFSFTNLLSFKVPKTNIFSLPVWQYNSHRVICYQWTFSCCNTCCSILKQIVSHIAQRVQRFFFFKVIDANVMIVQLELQRYAFNDRYFFLK
jgi:hypothetical protein